MKYIRKEISKEIACLYNWNHFQFHYVFFHFCLFGENNLQYKRENNTINEYSNEGLCIIIDLKL